jgi:ATP-binding cassette subfamily C protein LapB
MMTDRRHSHAPPLLAALASLLELRGNNISIQRLAAGLPGGIAPPTAADCLNAAEAAGAAPRLLHQPKLADIPCPALPCVLILQDGKDGHVLQDDNPSHILQDGDIGQDPEDGGEDKTRACVLLDMDAASGQATVILPENQPVPTRIALGDLEQDYSGYAIFIPQAARRDPRGDSLHTPDPGHWFWKVLREYASIYRDVALASFVVNLLSLASPLFIMNVYDRVVPNNAIPTLWVLALGLLAAHAMDFVLRNLRGYFVDVAGRNADVIIGSRLMDRVLHMRLDNKPESTGGLVNNLREFEQIRDFFGSTSLLALFDLPFLFVFIFLVAYIGGPLVSLALAALPLMLFFVWCLHYPFQRSMERQFTQNMQKNSLLVEIISGLETIKCTLAQGRMKKLWEDAVDASAKESTRARRLASLANTGSLFITYLINAGVIVWGVYRITEGQLTQGGLIACVILVSRALSPLMQISSMITQMQRSRVALKALHQIMRIPVEQSETQVAQSGGLSPDLAVEQLRFSYPGSPRPALIVDDLRISPGERIGIVGSTGSGKSTLARLLIGLYQPQEGSILFGGVDIRQIDQAELRDRIAYLPQENILFYGSVRDNIALGNPWLNMRQISQAAELTGVADFVKKHPLGYDMPVGERGSGLSGGQRQAVALARTLARNPEIFVLDEPSSNLDIHSERNLMQRLQSHLRGKTLVIMTHRPSLLGLVDRLVLLRDGSVALDGPRAEVLRSLQYDDVKMSPDAPGRIADARYG